MNVSRSILRVLLPLLVLAAAAGGAKLLAGLKPEVDVAPPEVVPPLVAVRRAEAGPLTLSVEAQGEVVPRTESLLVAQVGGRVVRVAPSFVNGGFFGEGDVLLSIDSSDYELAVEEARQAVSQAELRLARELADAEIARRDWESLGRGEATPLVLREPYVAEARSALAAARARVRKAELDVERCTVRAPYDGLVRSERVDAGQYVAGGTELGRVFAIDYAEVRLPLADDELAYLPAPDDGEGPGVGAPVLLRGEFAGERFEWQGVVDRIEAEIDPRTRMVTLVARVADPYRRGEVRDRPALRVGMFVEAEIEGRAVPDAVVLPRSALRDRTKAYVVDGEDRLRIRSVEVLKADRRSVVFAGGVNAGDRIVVSPLEVAIEGMRVRVLDEGDAR